MLCLVRYLFVISTSVIDCLGRFVPKMTYYVSSGTLNLTKLKLWCFAVHMWMWMCYWLNRTKLWPFDNWTTISCQFSCWSTSVSSSSSLNNSDDIKMFIILIYWTFTMKLLYGAVTVDLLLVILKMFCTLFTVLMLTAIVCLHTLAQCVHIQQPFCKQ